MEFLPKALTSDESNNMILRIENHFERHGFGLWALELLDTGEFAGFTGLSIPQFEAHFTPCIEVGWRLGRRFWGRGFASEAAIAAVNFGFKSANLEEIVSFTASANKRSIAVMKRLGMKRNPKEDFDHPKLAEDNELRKHVLYRLKPSGISS